MPRKIILHAGLHKTATTFLQTRVWPLANDYQCITRPYTQQNHAFNKLQYADDSLYNESEMQREIAKFGQTNLILSDESFTGKPLGFGYINRSLIARRLAGLFPSADVVVFLRDQQDILSSQYSSYLRMPYGKLKPQHFFHRSNTDFPFEEYVAHPETWNAETLYFDTNDFHLSLDGFLYTPLVQLYQSLFERCHFFLYEDLVSNPEDVLSRLSDLMETPLPSNTVSGRTNAAMSPTQMERKRIENCLAEVSSSRVWRKLVRYLSPYLPVRQVEDVSAHVASVTGDFYTSDNSRLKQLLPTLNWSQHPDKYQ